MSKVIFITGASSGIGKATAIELIKHDYIVYCGARRTSRMDDLAKLGCKIVKLDVTDHDSNVEAIEQIINNEGRIDVLFNNAGYGAFGAVEDVPLEEMHRQFEVNLFGLADLTRLALPQMRQQKSGLIINTSSISGKIYSPLGAWYHASKYALEGFSDCLRYEVKQFGINVVILEPGLVETEWVDTASKNAFKYSAEGPYKEMVDTISNEYKLRIFKPYKPEVIAKVVHKAIKAKRPRTRYLVGVFAKLIVFGRRILSDRMFDRLLKIAKIF